MSEQPPQYDQPPPQQQQQPPPQGYGAPPQGQGYPPSQGYVQPQSPQGYPPSQGYAQPQSPQGYAQPPQGYFMQQQTNQTVVVQTQAAPAVTKVVVRKQTNHLLHFIICLICPWWIFVWLCVCICG
ncbi:cell death-inducing p53-target protein 1 homolog [Halichondria panicea]|uniref:cell death-inducing p53-target protein 1 homolog n=1 Tax=Halichondria panicea TaxID=6063 RepID=UPI00312B326E